ncbi:MAG: reprolysin-like metallopeptidase, partial [Vibrio gallaecicus]
SGSRTWVGEIDTTVKGTAAFVVRNGEIHGVIDIPGEGNFSIRPGDHNAHIIEEIDNSAMLTGESDAVIEAPVSTNTNGNDSSASDNTDSGTEGATVAISNDDGSIIDVYVAYDQDAAGGSVTSGTAQSLAELFIAYTNQAYENSSISQRVWLVGDVDGYDYTSGTDDGNPVTNTAEKNDLGNVKNGSITGLHDKRDEYHADLVLFFRPFTSGTCSGLAYLQTANDDVNWESSGFSVMQACNFGNTVFAHELGHNMGAMHDWYVDTRVAPATYAHGYIDITNKFRTIMAYGNRCDSLSISCGRVAHFSNPAVNYNGNATGVAGGTSVACASGNNAPGAECDADNARNFNEKALITSQFRESKVVWTGAVDTDWNNANNWVSNRGKPSATTIANHVPRAYDNVLIPAGVGNTPTIAGNAVARELTIASGATLNMTGGALTVGWAWEDAGGFNASAGTVKLAGPLGITLTSSSAFNHLEIGTGADTSEVMLDSDLNVDGNFTIKDGAKFKAGSHQINLAGNYNVSQSGFNKGSSRVVFDGTSQSVNKTTIATLLDEGFAAADNTSCCGSTGLPAGWASEKDTSNGILFADLGDGNGGVAYSWSSSSNTWIITKAFSLLPGVDYTFEFDARRRYADGTIIQAISAHYGLAQSSASMTNAIGSSLADGDVTTAFATKQGAFTVPTAGNYYIGINIKSTGVRTLLDNLVLKGSSALQFHDLQVSSGEATFLQALEVSNDLQVDAIANFGTHDVSVEGIVTNNGELKQTKSVPAGLNTSFIAIKNKTATTDKYFGVEVNPTTALGNTIVSIKGNQTCTAATGFVLRCYGVNPTTSGAATIKFYYRAAELNANSTPVIKNFSSGVWSVAPGVVARGGSADGSWVSSANLTASGTFGLDDATTIDTDPIAFTLVDQPNVPLSNVRTSSPITVSGINAPANISVSTGGSYDINGSGNFISTASTVTNTQTVRVRHTSSATPGTSVNTTLTIGPKSDTFTSTTVGPD